MDTPHLSLNQFFSASEARIDRWRTLNRVARRLANSSGQDAAPGRKEIAAVLEELTPIEELNGYPGPHLVSHVQERLKTGDWMSQ